MENLAILQARVSSTRLPKKVLLPLHGKAMLLRNIERIQKSNLINGLVIATSISPDDNAIEEICRNHNFWFYRGSLENVLDRFYQAALKYNPRNIVRLTADCPLIDPSVIDKIIELHITSNFDYTSNTIPPTFPDGLDAEVFTFKALERAWKEATLPSEKEHVTPYIHKHPAKFRLGNFQHTENLSHYRWTVDTKEDFQLVEEIYKNLYPRKSNFDLQDILNLLIERPYLFDINKSYRRNEGYQKSLKADKQ